MSIVATVIGLANRDKHTRIKEMAKTLLQVYLDTSESDTPLQQIPASLPTITSIEKDSVSVSADVKLITDINEAVASTMLASTVSTDACTEQQKTIAEEALQSSSPVYADEANENITRQPKRRRKRKIEQAKPLQDEVTAATLPAEEVSTQNEIIETVVVVEIQAQEKGTNDSIAAANEDAQTADVTSSKISEKTKRGRKPGKKVIKTSEDKMVVERIQIIPAICSYLEKANKSGKFIWFLNDAEREASLRVLPKDSSWTDERVALIKIKVLPQGGYICDKGNIFPDKSMPARNGILVSLEKQSLLEEMNIHGVFAFFK